MENATDNLNHHLENQKKDFSTSEELLLLRNLWAFVRQGDRKIGFTYGEWYKLPPTE